MSAAYVSDSCGATRARSGASTVAELAAIGRPAILVPLPHALDQDQLANATVLEKGGGALRIDQAALTPDRLAAEISALAAEPARLTSMAASARAVGALDAADRLASIHDGDAVTTALRARHINLCLTDIRPAA